MISARRPGAGGRASRWLARRFPVWARSQLIDGARRGRVNFVLALARPLFINLAGSWTRIQGRLARLRQFSANKWPLVSGPGSDRPGPAAWRSGPSSGSVGRLETRLLAVKQVSSEIH